MLPNNQLGLTGAIAFGLCLAVGFNSAAVGADETGVAPGLVTAAAAPVHRPRVGLVLAGGGAKGGAHVGVIKVLEEQHVPIDCIAGTSMGALIGGGYAAGMPAAELEAFIKGIDWNFVVGGVGRRRLEPIEQKRLKTSAASDVVLGVQNGQIVTPAGLADTSAIDDLLRTYVAKARAVADFDQLPIQYRAVATDMVTGKMVVLKDGDLATAMRASMAIPGAFAPVTLKDYILTDGGQVRNIPVDVAREACADVVIVVNLVEPSTPPEKLIQATQLLVRSMEVMLEANENVQLATLTDQDLRIDVEIGDIGTADFPRVPETIPLGEQAARKVAEKLARYSVAPADYVAWRERVTMHQAIDVRVANVRFEGLDKVNPEYLRTRTRIRPGDDITIEAISNDAMRMSVLDDVDSVAYRLEGNAANPTLVWMPREPSVGHGVLRPSTGIYAAGGGDFKFLLGTQYVRHWLNDRGGQWRNNLQVGYETLLRTSLYQPFDVAQRYFVEPTLFGSRSVEDLYVDGDRIAVYRFIDLGGGIEFGVNAGSNAQLRLGYVSSNRESDVQTGIANLPGVDQRVPELDLRDAGIVASATYDSRDQASFARHGLSAEVQYTQSDESLGADRDWSRIEAGFRRAVPFGTSAIWLSLAGGADLGDDPLPGDRAFALGGPRTMPAYQLDELRVRSYWLADATVVWRIVELSALKNQAIYAGFGLQALGVDDRVDRVADDEIYGASAYIGGPTPIGNVSLGVAGASDSWGIWLELGRPVGKGSILDDGLFR
jgi:NTE family protein